MLLLRALAELIAPSSCAGCDEAVAPNVLFCTSCAATVERTSSAGAVFVYGGAIVEAIHRFKFQSRPDLVARFAPFVAELVPPEVDLVVPVPLHPVRLAERGYNPSALLGRPVARARGLPFHARALERVRDTPMQSKLDHEARQANVVGAFIARDFRAGATGTSILAGRTIALVDDVRTTGSTLRACVDALHEVGARAVFPLVVACANGSAL